MDMDNIFSKTDLHKVIFEDEGKTKIIPCYYIGQDDFSITIKDKNNVIQVIGKRNLIRFTPVTPAYTGREE